MKNSLKKISLLSLLAFVFLSFTFDWSLSDKDFLSKIIGYHKINRQEKLYLHTDKPIYITGEDLWFSIYLNDVSTSLPNKTEKVVYVELINPNGKTVLKNLYQIENGRGAGQIELMDTLSTGNYLLLAYTNWMRNFSDDFYFKKEVIIVNDNKKSKSKGFVQDQSKSKTTGNNESIAAQTDLKQSAKISLRFFPEGGNIVNGILSKIAFEGVDQYGNPATFSGKVIDNTGESVTLFQPMWEGKGMFTFLPQSSKQYKAIINKTDTFDLPSVLTEGYQLAIESSFGSDKLLLKVQGSATSSNQQVFILAMQDQKPMMAFTDSLVNNTMLVSIKKSELNTGIVQFTLFDAQKIPRCERLVFINHYDFTTINIEPSNPKPAGREKITLNISTHNQQGQPVPGTFSLAVTDANRISDKYYKPLDFVSHHIFGSDLPSYNGDVSFVMKKSQRSAIQTDLVMLTNGWRRYKWKEVLKQTITTPKLLEEPGIYLKGKVMKSSAKLAGPDVQVFMRFNEKERGDRYFAKTDDNSEFTFLVEDFTDSLVAILTTKNQKEKFTDYNINLESNIESRAIDLKAKSQLSDQTFAEEIKYEGESVQTDVSDLKKSKLATELVRAKSQDFFVDTTNVSIDEVKILGTKVHDSKGAITNAYGAPAESVGTKQIEDLTEAKDWNSGIIDVISDAFPGLEIFTSTGGSAGVSEMVNFLPRDRKRHRFFVYVDGKMVGASDDKGVLRNMLSVYEVKDLISLTSSEVESVDLIYPQQGTSKFKLNSEALRDAKIDIPQNAELSISDSNLSTETDIATSENGEVTQVDPLKDLKNNQMFYSAPEAILSIYTKSGQGLYARSNTEGITKIYLTGFTKVKEFYSPDYSDAQLQVKQDKRTTLYWNPVITTDANGMAQVDFYNTDMTSLLRAEAVGFSQFGKAGNTRIVFGQEQDANLNSANASVNDNDSNSNEFSSTENWVDDSKQKYQVLLSSNQSASYAFVSVPSKKWGTMSDFDGVFYIDQSIVEQEDTVFFSYGGEESLAITQSEMADASNTITLKANITMDPELDGEKIFTKAIKSIFDTKLRNTEYANSVYRQQIFKGEELHYLLDLKTELKLPNYYDVAIGFAPNPLVGRIFKIENYDNDAEFSPYNNSGYKVPILDVFFKEVTFIKSSYRKYYDFNYLGTCMYQNRKVYKVSFDQNKDSNWSLSSGYALIDAENYGFAYFSWKHSDKGSKYIVPDMFLMGGTKHKDFKLINEENQAFYYFTDGTWKFKGAVQNVEFHLNKNTHSYKREMLITDYLGTSLKSFKNSSLMDMKTRFILVKEPRYLPHLWRDAWYLPADEVIQKNIPYMHEIIFLTQPE